MYRFAALLVGLFMNYNAFALLSAIKQLLHYTAAHSTITRSSHAIAALILVHCCTVAWRPHRMLHSCAHTMQFYDFDRLHNFLDGFYMSRIGIRILILHYLALRDSHDGLGGNGSAWIGAVSNSSNFLA
jgi:Mitochondrial branched-chain alpha-ketoacid dehydrogenase kinase